MKVPQTGSKPFLMNDFILPSDQMNSQEYDQNSIQEDKDFPQPKIMVVSPSIPKDRH